MASKYENKNLIVFLEELSDGRVKPMVHFLKHYNELSEFSAGVNIVHKYNEFGLYRCKRRWAEDNLDRVIRNGWAERLRTSVDSIYYSNKYVYKIADKGRQFLQEMKNAKSA